MLILLLMASTVHISNSGIVNNQLQNSNISEIQLGARCSQDAHCSLIPGSYCSPHTATCMCGPLTPVRMNNFCLKARRINSECNYTEECSFLDKNSHCMETYSHKSLCQCKSGYYAFTTESRLICSSYSSSGPDHSIPAGSGLGLGLLILLFLLVFVVRLFSKARSAQARGYSDPSVPPTIVIDGNNESPSECAENQVFCAGDPLSLDQLRKMSILSSVTLPLNKEIKIRSVSPSNSEEYERFFGTGTSESQDFEQHITIISNRPLQRRASMANHAFPELHSKPKSRKSGNLLILTRTRTDKLGRRHSCAVPLIPPSGFDIQTDILAQTSTTKDRSRKNSCHPKNASQGSQLSQQSPDRLQIPRTHSTRRRSSKQDFLHFLDLAIAK